MKRPVAPDESSHPPPLHGWIEPGRADAVRKNDLRVGQHRLFYLREEVGDEVGDLLDAIDYIGSTIFIRIGLI